MLNFKSEILQKTTKVKAFPCYPPSPQSGSSPQTDATVGGRGCVSRRSFSYACAADQALQLSGFLSISGMMLYVSCIS